LTGRINPFMPIEQTIPEALHDSGRTTWAILPSEALRYAGQTLLSRGLDHLDVVVNDRGSKKDVGSYTTSVETADHGIAALTQLARAKRPFFLWLHFFDVHEHAQVEATDPRLAEFAGPDALRSKAGRYHALVALTDREIGRFLEELERQGLADKTVVVFFTDHGESLGDDPRLPESHGRFVYNPLVHVPLAFRIPAVEGTALPDAVSLLDMPATVLELLAIDRPKVDGWSLLPLITADVATLGPRALPLHESDQWGVVAWPWKLMVRPRDNLIELYDLANDFDERTDLAERDPDQVRVLKALYAQFPPVKIDRSPAGREERERLARPPGRN
jgi:arylsulfatase A-like enzyme